MTDRAKLKTPTQKDKILAYIAKYPDDTCADIAVACKCSVEAVYAAKTMAKKQVSSPSESTLEGISDKDLAVIVRLGEAKIRRVFALINLLEKIKGGQQ